MTVIIATDVPIDTSPLAQFGPNSPLIGWDSEIIGTDVVASHTAVGFPASNLTNPSTYLKWKSSGTAGLQSLMFNGLTLSQVDYVAIAGHNFGSAAIPIGLIGYDNSTSPPNWITLVPQQLVTDDNPIIFRFAAGLYSSIQLLMGSVASPPPALSAAPQAAVAYVGKILLLERKIWVEHTPITYGRTAKVANGRSENGNFLGRIVINEKKESTVSVQFISPAYYRSDIDPFIEQSKEYPFFFAWRPDSYPDEVGYAWMMNEPKVTHAAQHGLMALEMQIQGLA